MRENVGAMQRNLRDLELAAMDSEVTPVVYDSRKDTVEQLWGELWVPGWLMSQLYQAGFEFSFFIQLQFEHFKGASEIWSPCQSGKENQEKSEQFELSGSNYQDSLGRILISHSLSFQVEKYVSRLNKKYGEEMIQVGIIPCYIIIPFWLVIYYCEG